MPEKPSTSWQKVRGTCTQKEQERGETTGGKRERVGGSNPLWRSKLQLAAWSETIVFAVSTGGLCTVCISGCVYVCAGQCVCVSVYVLL